MVKENRTTARQRILKSAKIVFDDWTAIDCAVRDVSETGAKVKVAGAPSLPAKFQLLMLSDNTIRPVQVTWKQHDSVGVVFSGAAKRAPIRKF